jgi:hypothetical protein
MTSSTAFCECGIMQDDASFKTSAAHGRVEFMRGSRSWRARGPFRVV